MKILVGTASWTDKSLIDSGKFYPPEAKSPEARLRHYASLFPMVEVDSSYYAMPSASTAQLWAERTPADFVFNVKSFRLFTGHATQPKVLHSDIRTALPEALAGVAANLNVSAATLLKQLNAVQDALTEARRDKSDQGALIDQLASELGFFIARAEPFAAVWALMCSVPPEGAPPIAKWITTRNNSNNRRDWQVSASPVSAAADLANSLWRQAAGAHVAVAAHSLRSAPSHPVAT
mgnify:CR=1 FL=1